MEGHQVTAGIELGEAVARASAHRREAAAEVELPAAVGQEAVHDAIGAGRGGQQGPCGVKAGEVGPGTARHRRELPADMHTPHAIPKKRPHIGIASRIEGGQVARRVKFSHAITGDGAADLREASTDQQAACGIDQ